MRTATAGEIAVVAAAALSTYARLEITSPDGAWKNVSSDLAGGHDWLNSVQVSEQIDSNTMGFSAELLRDASSTLSLAPLREDSTVNRNLANVYAPMLDLHRKWRFTVAVIAHGTSPISGDWKQIGTGYVDIIDVNHPTASISVSGRGEEAALLDTEMLTVKTYSTGSTAYMEDVIQAMINDHWDTSYGATPVLYTPVATSFVINQFDQPAGNLMNALTAIANLIGASLRYRYDAANVNRLTLYVPNRTATIADWDIESTEYLRIPRNRLDITGVRNYVRVNYVPTLGGTLSYTVSPNTGTSGSITTFGKRAMLIDLSEDTQINTSARAQALGDAIVADLEYPKLEQMFETFGFWYVQLQDYGKTVGNGIHYEVGNDQEGGVSGYTHMWANGALRTSVELGGQPKSGYKRWRPLGEKPLPVVPPIIYDPIVPPFIPTIGDCVGGITGCWLWLLADSLLTSLSNNANVSQWSDMSGNANHAVQGAAASQPLFKTNQINGLPAVYFNTPRSGANPPLTDIKHLLFPSFAALTAGEIFLVLKNDADPQAADYDAGSWFIGTDQANFHPNTNGIIYDSFGTNVRKTTVNPTPSLTAAHIYNVSSIAGEWTSRLNGTQLYTTATNTVAFAALPKIGSGESYGSSVYNYRGYMAEIIMWTRKLTTSERGAVLTYLTDKYDI